jgi:cbb3-type cytochrome c oxidase subunit III
MRARKITLTVLSALVLSLLAATTPLALHQPANAQNTSDAASLFNENCAKCHGKDGRAKTMRGKTVGARNLTDAKWQAKETDEEILAAIKKGPGAMPSFEKKLSQAQLESLVSYVRSLKREKEEEKKKS